MKTTLQLAINKYGADNQLNMVIEECAELIQAINKVKRSNLLFSNKIINPFDQKQVEVLFNLSSKIASVEIMLEQVKLILPTLFNEAVEISKERKVERLFNKINKNENNSNTI